MQTTWRQQQHDALKAMSIPTFALRSSTVSETTTAKDVSTPPNMYRLGSIYLSSAEPLPVELPRWLEDLCHYWDCRPVAVKAPEAVVQVVEYESVSQQMQTASGKRRFWQQLCDLSTQ